MTTLPPLLEAAAGRLREELTRACGEHLVAVRLFGSRVRGDARPDSDLDVFIELDTDDASTRTAAQNAAWDVSYEMELPFWISPLVMSSAHFQRLLGLERLIAKDIMTEGVAV